jgi:hypothetical protein
MNNNNLESLAEEVLEAKAKEIYGNGWQKALTAFRLLAESEPLISNITLAAMKEMYRAGQQSQQEAEEWVSVNERLPDVGFFDSKEILALCGSRQYVLDYVTDDKGGRFYLSLNYPKKVFEDFTEHVTHWMPLPTPPIQTN